MQLFKNDVRKNKWNVYVKNDSRKIQAKINMATPSPEWPYLKGKISKGISAKTGSILFY